MVDPRYVAQRLESGISSADIARELGVSRQRISQIVHKLRNPGSKARSSQRMRDFRMIWDLAQGGKSIEEIVAATGRKKAKVVYAIRAIARETRQDLLPHLAPIKTEVDIEDIVRMHAQGFRKKQIADCLGVGASVLNRILDKHACQIGVLDFRSGGDGRPRAWDYDESLRLVLSGMYFAEVARKYGIPYDKMRNTIRRLAKNKGIEIPRGAFLRRGRLRLARPVALTQS